MTNAEWDKVVDRYSDDALILAYQELRAVPKLGRKRAQLQELTAVMRELLARKIDVCARLEANSLR